MAAATLARSGAGVWEREETGLELPPARGCPLPARLRNRGARLLNQQFWLWGQDVRRTEGNLLREFGFAHHPPPQGTQGSHVYLLAGDRLALWGFGLNARWEEASEIYVGRFRFEPRFPREDRPLADVFLPAQLAPLVSPRGEAEWDAALLALATTARWIAAYERWATARAGADYRAACLSRWDRTACAAEEIASIWDELAAACLIARPPR
jgi:hypothetical protein